MPADDFGIVSILVVVTHVNEMPEVGQDHRSRLCKERTRRRVPQSKATSLGPPLALSFKLHSKNSYSTIKLIISKLFINALDHYFRDPSFNQGASSSVNENPVKKQ